MICKNESIGGLVICQGVCYNGFMKDAMNIALDKIERGETPSKAELRAAGLCQTCSGFGDRWNLEGDVVGKCRKCGGDGRHRAN